MTTGTIDSVAVGPRVRQFAGLLLALLLLLLAARMTGAETIRETLAQKEAQLAASERPDPTGMIGGLFIGPSYIVAECAILLLIAAATAALAAFSTGLSRGRLGQFALITAFLACGVMSMLQAGNRFNAVIGLADVAMAIVAGWTIAVLCNLLGDHGRRLAIAGLVAILTLWVCKGLMQYFVEFPDTLMLYREHRDEILRNQGIINDPVQTKLFDSRVNSAEVSGFIAFSNVFANGLIGLLALVAGVLVCSIPSVKATTNPNTTGRGEHTSRKGASTLDYRHGENKRGEIPIRSIAWVLGALLAIAGLVLLPLTGSKGGWVLGYVVFVVVICVGMFWRHVLATKHILLPMVLLLLIGGVAVTLFYGIGHDGLPTKSLLFRWHYWTASKPMIEQSPLWGVGLNNFGDYYTRFKRPSSPEDVKDPHNFFVRLAAEAGVPAAVLIAVLLGGLAWGIYRKSTGSPAPSALVVAKSPGRGVIVAGALVALAWAAVHLLFFTEQVEFNVYIAIIFALVAAGAFAAVMLLLSLESRLPAMSFLCLTALIAAGAMLVYDQINMALVTGPVAMLFWVILGIGDSTSPDPARPPSAFGRISALLASLVCTGAALTLLLAVWLPLLSSTMPWDPAPYEREYVQKMAAGDLRGARAALETAMQQSPNSIELLVPHIGLLRDRFHEPVADDIRKVMSLDRANARIRVSLALPDSALPPAERIAMLQEALALDQQLPAEEYKRLPPEGIAQIQSKIAELSVPAK